MSGYDIDTVLGWRGDPIHDPSGERIGTVGDVFLDRETDRPAWIGVKTGLFGAKESYVPLSAAQLVDGRLQVPYSQDQVKDAPRVDADVSLSPEEERRLYAHYGEEYAGEEEQAGSPGEPGGATAGHGGDEAMTRSEEEVRLGHIERRPTERVRIRKVTVTDHVERKIPVQREVIALEHEAPSGKIESVEDLGEVDVPPGDPAASPGAGEDGPESRAP